MGGVRVVCILIARIGIFLVHVLNLKRDCICGFFAFFETRLNRRYKLDLVVLGLDQRSAFVAVEGIVLDVCISSADFIKREIASNDGQGC